MPYKVFRDNDNPPEWNVWKVDEKGEKVEKKNSKPYASRKAALPYFRKLWQVEREPNSLNSMIASVGGRIHFEADALNPRLLHFKDYVLARPETNKNRDGVDEAGIKELAETIAGMPIDKDHDPRKNVGVFTAGRVGSEKELRTDGLIWLDRCEENDVDPEDVLNGAYGMSIEADATSAECSVCHKVHANESEYCDHIKVQGNDMGLRAKLKYGASRIMRGLRALGGAFTYKPAGSGTGADSSSRIVFAAMEVKMANELTSSEIVELWLNEIVAAISKREDVSEADKKRAEKEYGDVEYADEKNKKYPLDEKHVVTAWRYIHVADNAAKYSPEEVAAMKSRIKRAAKKFGIELSEDDGKKNEEKASMDDKEKKETPAEEKKESPAEEQKEKKAGEEMDMKAEYEAMKANFAKMSADLEAAQKELKEKATMESKLQAAETQLAEAEKTIKDYRVNELRAKLVGSVLDEEEFTAKQDALLALPTDAIELMTRNRTEKKPSDGRLGMAATDQTGDTVTVKLYRS